MTHQRLWQQHLGRDEQVVFEFSISDRFRNVNLLIAALVSIPLLFAFGLGIITFVAAWFILSFYLKVSNIYCLTDRRIIIHRGWLSTNTISIDYDRITDVTIIQPFFEWLLFKSGSIYVNTAGLEVHEIKLPHIDQPNLLKQKIYDLINESDKKNKS
ncbi:MAG: PH domain-containing protein [Candidatus Doudnabacteria bacterium]|nr:PH domain-containing protein [Candidatus Doudnabacteria bacterium]